MNEDEARAELETILVNMRTNGRKAPKNQLDIWIQQIRMRGKGYFVNPEAKRFIEDLKREEGL